MIGFLEKNKLLSFMFVVLLLIEIFYFSTLTGGTGTAAGGNWPGRIYHFSVFFLLTFFLFIFIKGKKKINSKYIFIVLLFAFLFGVLDEIHQIFVPGRDASFRDIFTNSLGMFCAILACFYASKKNE